MENAKILIVEDQKTTAKKIEKDLLKMGYTVTAIVPTGEGVIGSIEENKPDLVLMDIILEGKMDGIDASEQIQERFDIPVVFLTAFADNTRLERAKKTEPYGYLIKPFEARELRTTIESAIYKHNAENRLKSYQNDLENMVKERTRELEKAKCELENRVAERTEELSKTNNLLQDSLKEKDALLQEIHHRVKNNMQMICSLINLRSKNLKDKECVEIFEDCVNRIKSMALIHENLYKSNDFAKVNLTNYIKDISDELILFFGISRNRVKINYEVTNISLGIDDAIPCGLIINELVSNAFKHAFPGGKEGVINIKIGLTVEDELELIFSDNGIGAPLNVDFENIKTLGLRLVHGLATKQLRGKLEMNTQNGTEFYIRFKRHV